MLNVSSIARRIVLPFTFSIAVLTSTLAQADTFTLAWDANPEPDVLGYYVFIGTTSGNYSTVVDVGNATTYTFGSALPGTTYYATVAAYVSGPALGPQAPELVTTTPGAPTLDNPGNMTLSRGAAFSLTLSASDPNNDPITYAAFGLPTGLSLNPVTGTISGTPAMIGTFNASATASDPSGNVAAQYFTWTVAGSDTMAPTVAITSPTTLSAYTTPSEYVTLSGTAGDDVSVTTVSWANSKGGSGTAAGTTTWFVVVPVKPGSNVLMLTARDASGKSSSTTLTVTVEKTARKSPRR